MRTSEAPIEETPFAKSEIPAHEKLFSAQFAESIYHKLECAQIKMGFTGQIIFYAEINVWIKIQIESLLAPESNTSETTDNATRIKQFIQGFYTAQLLLKRNEDNKNIQRITHLLLALDECLQACISYINTSYPEFDLSINTLYEQAVENSGRENARLAESDSILTSTFIISNINNSRHLFTSTFADSLYAIIIKGCQQELELRELYPLELCIRFKKMIESAQYTSKRSHDCAIILNEMNALCYELTKHYFPQSVQNAFQKVMQQLTHYLATVFPYTKTPRHSNRWNLTVYTAPSPLLFNNPTEEIKNHYIFTAKFSEKIYTLLANAHRSMEFTLQIVHHKEIYLSIKKIMESNASSSEVWNDTLKLLFSTIANYENVLIAENNSDTLSRLFKKRNHYLLNALISCKKNIKHYVAHVFPDIILYQTDDNASVTRLFSPSDTRPLDLNGYTKSWKAEIKTLFNPFFLKHQFSKLDKIIQEDLIYHEHDDTLSRKWTALKQILERAIPNGKDYSALLQEFTSFSELMILSCEPELKEKFVNAFQKIKNDFIVYTQITFPEIDLQREEIIAELQAEITDITKAQIMNKCCLLLSGLNATIQFPGMLIWPFVGCITGYDFNCFTSVKYERRIIAPCERSASQYPNFCTPCDSMRRLKNKGDELSTKKEDLNAKVSMLGRSPAMQ